MINKESFTEYSQPFKHWINTAFLPPEQIEAIHAEWPKQKDERWMHEKGIVVIKSALLFPHRIPPQAHALAEKVYSQANLDVFSEWLGVELFPDPYFLEGPLKPMVGGGLHEIYPRGFLKVHVDFALHPTGMNRAANLLIYLTTPWRDEWGGHLELHGGGKIARIAPRGGTAIFFATNDTSWHGHPSPLLCPPPMTRRSLALYFYSKPAEAPTRKTTLYRATDKVKP